MAQKRELGYAAGIFPSIEINGTFYGLQRPEAFGRWRAETPDDFVFAIKGSRYITYMLKLRNVEAPLANFFASGVLRLGPKLGPILWQFPPRMKFDPERFRPFLHSLLKNTMEAADLARRHDDRLNDRSWLTCDVDRPLRHALEIRDDSFRDPRFIALLREYGVALVCADTVEWPLLMDVTSDFIYCRLQGSEQLYVSGYDHTALDSWADRVRTWSEGGEPNDAHRVLKPTRRLISGRDVYVYFDNDAKVRAPFDAKSLMDRLAQ